MSAGIPLKEIPPPNVDRAEGDVHVFGNPHYTLSLIAGQRMVATLTKALVSADPATHVRKLKLMRELGVTGGFRTVINTGPDGGQEVYHLHMHVMGGPRPWSKG